MAERIFEDFDKETGILERFHHDEKTGVNTIMKVQDIEPILQMNKSAFNEHNRAEYGDSNGAHLVARIPLILIDQWKMHGFDWFNATDNERRQWLDRPENAMLKVRPGKLGGTSKRKMTFKAS